jgi:hypothetical protein
MALNKMKKDLENEQTFIMGDVSMKDEYNQLGILIAILNKSISDTTGARDLLIQKAAPTGASYSTAPTGTDASGKTISAGISEGIQRPQNLYINIDKLIETQEIKTTNMTEGAAQIKSMVSQALLEAVSDINNLTK